MISSLLNSGKAFCLDVEIQVDGELLQEIKSEGETGFLEHAPTKNLVAQLKNMSPLWRCYLAEPQPSLSSNAPVMKATSGSSLREVNEDHSFGEPLVPKPPVVKDSSRQGVAVKRTRLSSSLSSSSSGSSSHSSVSSHHSSCSSCSFGAEDPLPPVLKKTKSKLAIDG